MSIRMSSSAHRSTWRRNRCPRPRFSLAPSMSPGTSASRSRGLPRTTSLNSITPIWGWSVVKGYAAVFGRAFVIALTSDDFPALGNPTRPTSAMDFRTSRNTPCSPTWPGLARLGARFVELLKCVLPQPPLPPLHRTIRWPSSTTSATTHRVVAVAPLAQDDPLAVLDHLGDDPVGLLVGHDRTERQPDRGIAPLLAVAVLALAVLAPPRLPVRLEPVVDQVVRVVVAEEDDVPSPPSVAAVGPPPGLVLLAAERDAAASAVAGGTLDHAFIDKHGSEATEIPRAIKSRS